MVKVGECETITRNVQNMMSDTKLSRSLTPNIKSLTFPPNKLRNCHHAKQQHVMNDLMEGSWGAREICELFRVLENAY